MTKRRKTILVLVGVVVVIIVIASLAAYESNASYFRFFYPIIAQCTGSMTAVLYNGNLFVPVSYDLRIYGFDQSSGRATTDSTIYTGSLAAHEQRSLSTQLECGTYRAAVMWNGGGSWLYKDATISRNQLVDVDLSY